MSHVLIPVDNTDVTVTRMAAEQSVKSIMGKLKIPRIEQIKYIPRGDKSNVSPLGNNDNALQLDLDKYIIVEYAETFDEDACDNKPNVLEYQPLFTNKAIGVAAVPLHTKVKLELTISYRSTNYDDLTKCLNEFRLWKQQGLTSLYHDVNYNYTIPRSVLEYLNQCHQLTESVAPYGTSLKDFMLDGFGESGINIRKNITGSKSRLVYNGTMKRCLGIFTSAPDVIETSREPPKSELRFTYVLYYERINYVRLVYQKYIHNQVIDLTVLTPYYSHRPFFNPWVGYRPVSQEIELLTQTTFNTPDNIIRIPGDDDGWLPNFTTKDMRVLMVVPLWVDPLNRKSIFPIDEFKELGFIPELVDNLKLYPDLLLVPYRWFFYVEVWEVNRKTYKIPIEVVDGVIQAKTDMDLRSRHYMQISICTNVSKVDFTDIKLRPTVLQYFFNVYDPSITLDVIGNGKCVTRQSILKAINIVNNTDNTLYPYYLVNTANILARRTPHA